MTASATHELVTPLQCIIQFGETLMTDCEDEEKKYEKSKLIVDTATLLLAQVKCFLDESIREASNSFTPNLTMCSLKNTLKQGVRILKSQASVKNIKLSFSGLLNDDSLVMMDSIRMQ